MNAKPFWASKTLWMQIVAAIVTGIQLKWGWVAPPEYQAYIFVALNMLLRFVTRGTVVLW